MAAISPVCEAPPATGERSVLERHLPCMGGNAHLTVVASDDSAANAALSVASDRLARLENVWSRFRADSEVSRLGDAGGRPVAVSADTRLLIRWCMEAWRRTGGRFDPTVGSALERLGYDRSFSLLEERPSLVGDSVAEFLRARTRRRGAGASSSTTSWERSRSRRP